ncbi:VOC family protein [Gracilibacillus sp. JCM 18860]|uniref:VOC family protein n=1 Tax=Gracilibacillus sp. JCM 18860 TaxID=1306159 RepID=UPI000AC9432A
MTFSPSMTFINLPVKDLEKSMNFFKQIGFSFNPQFTDENAASMVINDNTFSMLLTEAHFQNFTDKEIVNATKQTECLVSFAVESREQVDAIIKKAIDAGGSYASEHVIMAICIRSVSRILMGIFGKYSTWINQGMHNSNKRE